MLKLEVITKSYGVLRTLNQVSLESGPEIQVVVGLNGSGKSTLLKIVAGIVKPDSGRVLIHGADVTGLAPEDRKVGYVPQQPALFSHLKVKENISYGLRNGRGSHAEIERLLTVLDLAAVLDKKPATLSGGYRSRVSLARALASGPLIILLDEPLSDLDVVIKEKLIPQFKEALHLMAVPVLYVTHDPLEAQLMGDRFSVLVDGRMVRVNSAEEAFETIRNNLWAHLSLLHK